MPPTDDHRRDTTAQARRGRRVLSCSAIRVVVIEAWLGLRQLAVGRETPVPPPRRRWATYLLWGAGLAIAVAAARLFLTAHAYLDAPCVFAAVAALPAVTRRPLLAWRVVFCAAVAYLVFLLAVDAYVFPGAGPSSLTWSSNYPLLWRFGYPLLAASCALALIGVGLRSSRAVLAWATAALLVLTWTGSIPFAHTVGAGETFTGYAVTLVLLAIVVGSLASSRSSQRAAMAADERATVEREHRSLLEERTRIARELHDVVAHHMSLIAVQSETAPYRLDEITAGAREEFQKIAGTSREALTEMRRVLGVLRDDRTAELAPQPGVVDCATLVQEARDAGSPVELQVSGHVKPLPSGVDVSAYRIVQESLSNARHHAPDSPVLVCLDYQESQLRIQVDNGPGASQVRAGSDGDGHGLIGMRERVAMLRGTLTAAATPDGGFRVSVLLPLDGEASGAERKDGVVERTE